MYYVPHFYTCHTIVLTQLLRMMEHGKVIVRVTFVLIIIWRDLYYSLMNVQTATSDCINQYCGTRGHRDEVGLIEKRHSQGILSMLEHVCHDVYRGSGNTVSVSECPLNLNNIP